jgi:hypothetical protein
MKNNLTDSNKSTNTNYPSNDDEIAAGVGPAKEKLAYLVVGSSLKSVNFCTKEKVT